MPICLQMPICQIWNISDVHCYQITVTIRSHLTLPAQMPSPADITGMTCYSNLSRHKLRSFALDSKLPNLINPVEFLYLE